MKRGIRSGSRPRKRAKTFCEVRLANDNSSTERGTFLEIIFSSPHLCLFRARPHLLHLIHRKRSPFPSEQRGRLLFSACSIFRQDFFLSFYLSKLLSISFFFFTRFKPSKNTIRTTQAPVAVFIITISPCVIPSKVTSIERCIEKIDTNAVANDMFLSATTFFDLL